MKLSRALNKLGKIVGKDKFISVTVELTSYGKKQDQKEEMSSEWSVYCETMGIFQGSTFEEAIKELKKSKSKPKFQDARVETK